MNRYLGASLPNTEIQIALLRCDYDLWYDFYMYIINSSPELNSRQIARSPLTLATHIFGLILGSYTLFTVFLQVYTYSHTLRIYEICAGDYNLLDHSFFENSIDRNGDGGMMVTISAMQITLMPKNRNDNR
ncbi:hypothetical protein GQX74_003138 [Glossina fuscipes]|nr:hypothetical protein GQX74_003138 [Glossina fuscipes]